MWFNCEAFATKCAGFYDGGSNILPDHIYRVAFKEAKERQETEARKKHQEAKAVNQEAKAEHQEAKAEHQEAKAVQQETKAEQEEDSQKTAEADEAGKAMRDLEFRKMEEIFKEYRSEFDREAFEVRKVLLLTESRFK